MKFLKNKVLIACVSILAIVGVFASGIVYLANQGVLKSSITLFVPNEPTIWGEASASVEGYYVDAENPVYIEPQVTKLNFKEAEFNVEFELPALEFGVAEDGGPAPIVVTFAIKITDMLLPSQEDLEEGEEPETWFLKASGTDPESDFLEITHESKDLELKGNEALADDGIVYVKYTITLTGLSMFADTANLELSASFNIES